MRTVAAIWGREIHLHRPEEDGPPPVLFKRLEADDVLSVQCHPRAGSSRGTKEEAWWFDAPPREGFVYAGLAPGASIEAILSARTADLPRLLAKVPVRRGEILRLPSGVVHALTPGARVFEMQEPNEVTIRLHDWDRGRACDPEAARVEADPSLAALPLGEIESAGPNGVEVKIGAVSVRLTTNRPTSGFFLALNAQEAAFAVVDSSGDRR